MQNKLILRRWRKDKERKWIKYVKFNMWKKLRLNNN